MAGSSLTKRNRRLKVHRGDQTWTSRPTTAPGDRGWESDDSAAWSAGERAANMSASAKSAEKARPKQPGHRGELICASQAKKAATTEQLRNADTYRRNQLSRMPLDLDGWDVHAALSGNDPAITHGGLFDWSIQDSGRVGLAAASAMGTGLAAAFASASLLSALRAHGSHPHTPDEMLGRLNQDIWRGSAGDQYANAWYAVLDPSSGQLDYSLAGSAELLLCRSGQTKRIDTIALSALGVDPETPFCQACVQLRVGDTLLIAIDNGQTAARPTIPDSMGDWLLPPRMAAKELVEAADGWLPGASPHQMSLLAIRCCGP